MQTVRAIEIYMDMYMYVYRNTHRARGKERDGRKLLILQMQTEHGHENVVTCQQLLADIVTTRGLSYMYTHCLSIIHAYLPLFRDLFIS